MQKSIHTQEYRLMVAMLRSERERLQITQADLAERLGITASQLSKWERRERRIDLLELDKYCRAAGINLADFVQQ